MSRSLKTLGIETSTQRAEVALAVGASIQAVAPLPTGARPTVSLVPTIRDLCRQVGWSPREIELVCVDIGPGSYTGLRVGLTCAKTLAFVAGAKLATAMSLDVTVANVPNDESTTGIAFVDVAFDAARGQVFECRYRRVEKGDCPPLAARGLSPFSTESGGWVAAYELRITQAETWAASLGPDSLVLGPALVKYRHLIPPNGRVADESLWWPRAVNVISLGARQFDTSPLASFWTLEPLYLRPSAAEEKRAANLERG